MTKLTVLILACMMLSGAVNAQTLSWSDPTGAFKFQIPNGWGQVSGAELGPEIKSTPILHVGPKEAGSDSGCSIYRLDHSAPGEVTQRMANSVIRDWDREYVAQQTRELGNLILGNVVFSNLPRDGVQVVSFAHDSEWKGSQIRYSQKQFMLATGGTSASFYTVGCSVLTSKADQDTKRANAFLSSLKFLKK